KKIISTNYQAGKRGFNIDGKTGNVELNNATFRGRIEGADGHFNGTVDAKRILGDVYFATNKVISGTPLNNKIYPKGKLETGWVKA
ncbi:hypothetical protein ACO0J5_19410, partial [Proteus mirabilis]